MNASRFAQRPFFGSPTFAYLLVILVAIGGVRDSSAQQPSTRTFLITSDFHFNPMADPTLVSKLAASDPTQWESILNGSKSTAFSQHGQDTNWWLLRSALDAMRSTLPHPAFIVMTGDLLAHRFPQTFRQITQDNDRESYRKFVLSTVKFLALQLQKRFPGTRILVTPGNNDEECGDYSMEAGGRFLHDTADIARKLAQANDEFRGSWEALGSYDIPHPAIRGTRIISIDTVFLSNKYHATRFSEGCAQVPSNAGAELFTWLEGRLGSARQAHQKVWLMFHIPPGMDGYSTIQQYQTLLKTKTGQSPEQACASALVPMWVPKWTAQFDDLLERYKDTVIVSLAGHTHSDDFRVINFSGSGATFVLINPAISPIYNQNPGFRVVSFAGDGSLTDASVYYLTNLLFASKTTTGEWKREYRFSQQWNMRGVNAATLSALSSKVQHDQADQAEWLKLYNISSSAAYFPPNSAAGFYCATEALSPEDYQRCFCSTVIQSKDSVPQ